MNAKEKAIKFIRENQKKKSHQSGRKSPSITLCEKAIKIAIEEVFDDIDKEFSKPSYLNDKNPYEILQELKKKHLKKCQ